MNLKSLYSPRREDNIRQILLNTLIKEQIQCYKISEEGEHSSGSIRKVSWNGLHPRQVLKHGYSLDLQRCEKWTYKLK